MWIEVPEEYHALHRGLRQEVEARLAARLPAGQCIKGPINYGTTNWPAGPGWLKYRVGYETEPEPERD